MNKGSICDLYMCFFWNRDEVMIQRLKGVSDASKLFVKKRK